MNTDTREAAINQESKPELFTGRNIAIACGVLTLLAICACIVSGVGMLAYYGREPEGLTVEYSIPSSVARGEEFDFVLTITNTGSEDVFVGDIDLDEAFSESILDGAITISTDPVMEKDFSVSGIKSFQYNRNIPAGSTQRVVFRLQAVSAGEFGGSVGVYVGDIAARIQYVGITITED